MWGQWLHDMTVVSSYSVVGGGKTYEEELNFHPG